MAQTSVPIISAIHNWYCPNCGLTDVTNEARPHTRFHTCPRLRGLTAPMLPAGTRAKVTAHDREDYVGTELVQVDENGRPVMSVVTEREDGSNDTMVFASTATARSEE